MLDTTGNSTNFVMDIMLKIDMSRKEEDPPNNWVRAGVAAFLSLRS